MGRKKEKFKEGKPSIVVQRKVDFSDEDQTEHVENYSDSNQKLAAGKSSLTVAPASAVTPRPNLRGMRSSPGRTMKMTGSRISLRRQKLDNTVCLQGPWKKKTEVHAGGRLGGGLPGVTEGRRRT